MAVDEALLEAMPRLGRPVLRFYSWTEPAVSFGYFQKFAYVESLTPVRPLVRRPTGGGIVPHLGDWTYSVVVPTTAPWYSLTARDSYRRVHEWIQSAFTSLAVDTELAPQPLRDRPGQCFAGYEQFDLLLQGRKIGGAAQRRRRDGLLIQGSVQPGPIRVSRQAWERAMCEVATLEREIVWSEFSLDHALQGRMEELVLKKYSQAAYNQGR